MTGLAPLWAFAMAALVAATATPAARWVSLRVNAVDMPKERGMHDIPKPRLGGLAIFLAVIVAGAIFMPSSQQTLGMALGASAVVGLGAIDDIRPVGALSKLLGQTFAALIPVLAGVRVVHVTLPWVGPADFGAWSVPLTLLGIVAVMNVVNFIDGVDGLAAGVAVIGAATFAIIAISLGRPEAGILAALTAGAALGFLVHNFPGRSGASIFMGDSGSNLLGLLLACIAVQGVLKTAAVVGLFFPLVILAVPLLDTSFVVLKRLKYRRPVYLADRWHLHHRFANIGFSPLRTILYLYAWTLALSALALALALVDYSDNAGNLKPAGAAVVVGFAALALAASLYSIYVLEILKFRRVREFQLRRRAGGNGGPPLSSEDVDEEIRREVETGELGAVRRE